MYYKCRMWFSMSKDEFLYDFSLDYINYMIQQYVTEFNSNQGERDEPQESNVYRITDVL